jgi:hypothetical protein
LPQDIPLTERLGICGFECGYRHRALDRNRFAKRFDAFYFVHGLGGKVRLAATGARPHGNGFDDQQGCALAKNSRDVLELR